MKKPDKFLPQVSSVLLGFLIVGAISIAGYIYNTREVELPNIEPAEVEIKDEPIANTMVLNFKDGTTQAEKDKYISSIGGTVVNRIDGIGSVVISVKGEVKAEDLPKSDKLASGENDYYVSAAEFPNDPDFDKQWGLEAIDIKGVWEKIADNSGEKVVAVIDSGACLSHEDLKDKFIEGWDYVNNDAIADDEMGHGCAVSGVLAAGVNNEKGIAGTAKNVKILPLKVLDKNGVGSYSNVADAIVRAVDNGVDVINLSIGGSNASSLLENAVKYAAAKNVTVVAAAGNTGTEEVLYPAKYDGVIAVGSIDPDKKQSSFSSKGGEVDVWAPGRDIYTTKLDGKYGFVSGTSFAAPMVSAVKAIGGDLNMVTSNSNSNDDEIVDTNSSNSQNVVALGTIQSPMNVGDHKIEPGFEYMKKVTTWYTCSGGSSSNNSGYEYHAGIDLINTNAKGTEEVKAILDQYGSGSSEFQNAKNACLNGSTDPGSNAIFAIGNGVVRFYEHDNYDGEDVIVIELTSASVPGWSKTYAAYAHLNTTGYGFNVGDTVTKGQQIGVMGDNANNPHLHFEIRNFVTDNFSGTSKAFGRGYATSSSDSHYYSPCSFIANNGGTVPSACGISTSTGDLGGVVRNSSGTVIPGASLTFEGSGANKTTTANSSGVFYFSGLPSGTGTLTATNFFNYKIVSNVKVNANASTWVEVYLTDACTQGSSISGLAVNPCQPASSGSCPSGNGLYCGSSVGLSSGTLYQCTNGVYQAAQYCGNGCQVNAPGTSDNCIGTPTGSCPYGNGLYCGSTVGLNSNVLYQCTNGSYQVSQACSSTCHVSAPGQSDYCTGSTGGGTTCPDGNGDYCGGTVGLDSNKLYTCNNGSYSEKQSCSNGCQANAPGTPDVCKAASSEKVKFYGDSQYGESSIRLELGPGNSNDPSKSTLYKSIKLPSGWSVKLFDEDNQRGNSKCLSQSEPLLESQGWHNRVESVYISTTNECPPTPQEGVRLCRGENKTDCSSNITTDLPSLGNAGIGNDQVKSVDIVGDWAITLFIDDNFNGIHTAFEGGDDNLNNDTIGYGASSAKVRKKNPSAYTLYTSGDYNGTEFKSDRTISDLGHWDRDNQNQTVNDKAQSIRVESGYEVLVCEHANFHGTCGRTNVSKSDINAVAQGLRNGASSVRVCQGGCQSAPEAPALNFPQNGAKFSPGSTINFNWTGGGIEHYIEVSGGGLASPVTFGWTKDLQWSLASLPASAQAYSWRVRSWSEFGEGGYSQPFTFYIQHIAPVAVHIIGPATAEPESDFTLYAYVEPETASNLAYAWSNEPVSGQGTDVATFRLSGTGEKTITLTVTNTGGTATTTHKVVLGCGEGRYLAEYYENRDLLGAPIYSQCEDKIDYNWGSSAPTFVGGFGDGRDGAITVAAGQTGWTDNTRQNLVNDAALNTSTICVANPSLLVAGDEILIIQMTGANAGNYEYNRIVAINSCNLTLQSSTKNTYAATNAKTQIMKVINATDLTLEANAILSPHAWDGSTGGVMAIKVQKTFTIKAGAKVDVSSLGFRGAQQNNSDGGGWMGEGEYGYITGHQTSANGLGAGGGCSLGYANAGAGGGGGHAANGQTGGVGYNNGCMTGGQGGIAKGNVNLTKMLMGGGGGAGGGKTHEGSSNYGGAGGTGGGIIAIYARNIVNSGVIYANGSNGLSSASGGANGGGGAGGTVKIETKSTVDTSRISAVGGNGGPNRAEMTGGAGSLGRVRITNCETNCGGDNFSIRWTGKFNFETSQYKFILNSDDGAKLYVDNNLIISKWIDGINTDQKIVDFTAGQHEVKVEYYENSGDASVSLTTAPTTNRAPVITAIPNQTIGISDSFTPIDLDNYGTDPDMDNITWIYTGNNQLGVTINSDNVVTVIKPTSWSGTETIQFIAKDPWGEAAVVNVQFKALKCNIGQYQADYFNNMYLNGNPVDTQCEDSINYDWSTQAPQSLGGFGTGVDGDLTVNSGQTVYTDNVRSQMTSTVVIGSTNIPLVNVGGFAAGREVLLIQHGGDETGDYEFAKIVSVTSNSIVIDHPTAFIYRSMNTTAQVIQVPQYNSVTVKTGGILSAHAWDKNSGGVVVMRVLRQLNVEAGGVINANYIGYTRGPQNNSDGTGLQGEGYWASNGVTTSANGISGGGGCSQGYANPGGGGGGGNLNKGATGGVGYNNGCMTGGAGGNITGNSEMTKLVFGGSGGSGGGKTHEGAANYGGAGGVGGGIVFVIAKEVNLNGTVEARGSDGYRSETGGANGGGGAGGSIKIERYTGNVDTSKLIVTGGVGGPNRYEMNGGIGSVGRTKVSGCEHNCGGDNFSVRWTAMQNFEQSDYAFTVNSDDGSRLYIDNTLVADNWVDGSTDKTVNVTLASGLHEIKMEYFENTGSALARLSWQKALPSVKLFNQANYAGNILLSKSEAGFTNEPNHDASSIQIPEGWSVYTWKGDNKTGEVKCWKSSAANLQDSGWNLAVESMEVFTTNQCPPTVRDIGNVEVNEDTAFAVINLDDYVEKIAPTETFSWVYIGNTAYTVSINTQNQATITYPANWNGQETIVFTATSSMNGKNADVHGVFVVKAMNDAPVFAQIPQQITTEDKSFAALDLKSFVTDVDAGDVFTYKYSGNTKVNVAIDSQGVVSAAPLENWFGDDTVVFSVVDKAGLQSDVTVKYIATPVNDPPQISSQPVTSAYVNEDYSYKILVSDIDSSNFTYGLIQAPTGMTITSEGVVQWNPLITQLGSYQVAIRISDGEFTKDQSFAVNVTYSPSSFVKGVDDHFDNLDGWTSTTVDRFSVVLDNNSLKVSTALATGIKDFTSTKWLSVETGKRYYLAANIKTQNADQPKVYVRLYDANYKLLSTPVTMLGTANTSGWKEYRTSYVVPAVVNGVPVKYAKIMLRSGNKYASTAVEAQTFFDDVYFSTNGRPYVGWAYAPTSNIKALTTLTLTASGMTDPDANKVFTYEWTQVSGPQITINNANQKVANFVAPNSDQDYKVKVSLVIKDASTSSIPVVKEISVIHWLPLFSEEFNDQAQWLNQSTPYFSTAIENSQLKVSSTYVSRTSQILSSFVKVDNTAYNLKYRVQSQNAGVVGIRVIGYNSALAGVTSVKCTATGMAGTKPMTEFTCPINLFKQNTSIKYARIRIEFTSPAKGSSAMWLDYAKLEK